VSRRARLQTVGRRNAEPSQEPLCGRPLLAQGCKTRFGLRDFGVEVMDRFGDGCRRHADNSTPLTVRIRIRIPDDDRPRVSGVVAEHLVGATLTCDRP